MGDDDDPADDEDDMEGEGREEDEDDSEDDLVGDLVLEDEGNFKPKGTDDEGDDGGEHDNAEQAARKQ